MSIGDKSKNMAVIRNTGIIAKGCYEIGMGAVLVPYPLWTIVSLKSHDVLTLVCL